MSEKDPYLQELDDIEGSEEGAFPPMESHGESDPDFPVEDMANTPMSGTDFSSEESSGESGEELLDVAWGEETQQNTDTTPSSDTEILQSDDGSYAEEAGQGEESVWHLSADVPVSLSVVMGRKMMTIQDLLGFKSGHVIEFDKTPGQAIDLVVSGKVIGKGELVLVSGKLGVRILRFIK